MLQTDSMHLARTILHISSCVIILNLPLHIIVLYAFLCQASSNACSNLHAVISGRVENSVDPDQLASQKPADLDLHSFLKMYIYA